MAKVLRIDEEALASARARYAEQAQAMETVRQNLVNVLAELRIDWDSDAGKEFFKKFDDDLDKNMQLYADVIRHMAENMDIASSRYGEVFREAERLKLDV